MTDTAFESPEAGQAILARARRLAFPRYPGTDGDRRAIQMVREWFEDAGLETSIEEFSYDVRPAFRALRVLLLSSAALLAGAAALGAASQPGWGLLLLAIAWLAAGLFLSWAPWLERIYRRDGPTTTANVVGVHRAPGADDHSPQRTVIVLAHHDSKSQNLTMPVRAGFTLAALGGSLALALALLLALAGRPSSPLWILAPAALACVSLIVLSTLKSGNDSPGGVDNAGSVAIVAALAEAFRDRVPPGVELVFLSPGAEEDHMVGAMRWLDRHLPDLTGRDVVAINLDGAGIPGRVVLLERYGFGKRFSPRLSRLARRVAKDLELPLRASLLPPAMGVDAIPFVHRGIDCLTLASGSLCPAVAAVHSPRDHGENLDLEALRNVARLAEGMVEVQVAKNSTQYGVSCSKLAHRLSGERQLS